MTIERKICRLEGCDKTVRRTGRVCSMHAARKARHGSYDVVLVDGRSKHPLWPRWKAMIERCEKPYSLAYKDYGDRGISVCARWHDFKNFLEDMGDPPTVKHTLDRINNDGNYEPGNVRWALRDVQAHNQRSRTKTGHKGIYLTVCNTFNASIIRGRKRINVGTFKTLEQAIVEYKGAERFLYGDC